MKRFLLLFLLFASPGYSWSLGGDGNSLDGLQCGRGLATAPYTWHPGEWDRTYLNTELLFGNWKTDPGANTIYEWTNTGLGTYSYSQSILLNKPVASGGMLWFTNAHELKAQNSTEDYPTGEVTRYYVVEKRVPFVSDSTIAVPVDSGYTELDIKSTGAVIWGTWAAANLNLNIGSNPWVNKVSCVVLRREHGYKWWNDDPEGYYLRRAWATNTLFINDSANKATGDVDGGWYEGSSPGQEPTILPCTRRIVSYGNPNWYINGYIHLYLAYGKAHSDAEVQNTLNAISKYLKTCRLQGVQF